MAEYFKEGKDSGKYLRSGLLYTLNKFSEEGHCYARRDQLIGTAQKLLGAEAPELNVTLDEMLRGSDVIQDGEAIYLPPLYYAEVGCAGRLDTLLHTKRKRNVPAGQVLARIQKQSSVPYDEIQLAAIREALTSKVMVLTGGPGTGKTTTTRGMIEACRMEGDRILLAAPTGRAAKRLSEATGMEAKTIHRLLEYKPSEGYQRKEENPLDADVLIVDECSLIDLLLMYRLLKALPDSITLILIGDPDQLPSVGAGNVLKDILSSGVIPVVRLTRIFRQAQGSRITLNAHRINHGQMPDLRGGRDSDFFFAKPMSETEMETASSEELNQAAADLLVKYCSENLPRYYHADALRDIQVLTPMQRGLCGAEHLNQLLQQALNPSGIFLKRGGTQFRLHDKVMQIQNDYDREVFIGDIGIITRVSPEDGELGVDFDGQEISYDVAELDKLVLAYAVTIHKARGSEYPIVVIPLTMSHYEMLQRNLLYTGVTRAKKALVIVGEKKAISCAVRNETTAARNTKLAARLQEKMSEREERYGRLFARLAQSKFRSRFSLSPDDQAYVRKKGMETIRSHAEDFIAKRLAPAQPAKDGKQTPMRGHPVFIAQHATATCCRGCLEKWHHIPKGRELTKEEQEYIVDVLMTWITRQMEGKSLDSPIRPGKN